MVKKFLPEKLNNLFDEKRKPNGDRYTYRDVARATGVSSSYISHLANGKRKKPSMDVISAIAEFFGVSISYFYENPNPAKPDILSDEKVQELTLRSSEISDEDARLLFLDMLQEIKKLRDSLGD